MDYVRLGDSGLVVSRMALGTMTFGDGGPAIRASMGKSEVDTVVKTAIDAGVNFFDTADMYSAGRSEELLGSALGAARKDVVIASKVGQYIKGEHNAGGLSRRHIAASVDGSLRRLGTDWLDLYFVHRVDTVTPLEETLEALDQCVKAGKVRYIGFSNWPAWMVAKAIGLSSIKDRARFICGQIYYSLAGREAEHELLPCMRDAGIGSMVWSPTARGFLAGRYTADEWAQAPLAGLFDLDPARSSAVLDAVTQIAIQRQVPPASIALAWLLSRPAVDVLTVGASSIDQLRGNIDAFDLTLDENELARLEEVSKVRTPYPQNYQQFVEAGDPPLLRAGTD